MQFLQRQALKEKFKLRLYNGVVSLSVVGRVGREFFEKCVSLGNEKVVSHHVHTAEEGVQGADVLIPEARVGISSQGPELYAGHGAQVRCLLMFHRQQMGLVSLFCFLGQVEPLHGVFITPGTRGSCGLFAQDQPAQLTEWILRRPLGWKDPLGVVHVLRVDIDAALPGDIPGHCHHFGDRKGHRGAGIDFVQQSCGPTQGDGGRITLIIQGQAVAVPQEQFRACALQQKTREKGGVSLPVGHCLVHEAFMDGRKQALLELPPGLDLGIRGGAGELGAQLPQVVHRRPGDIQQRFHQQVGLLARRRRCGGLGHFRGPFTECRQALQQLVVFERVPCRQCLDKGGTQADLVEQA